MAVDWGNLRDTTWWNARSVETIALLQDRLGPYERYVVGVSELGDNRQMFCLFFPVLAGLNNVLGAKVLWATILAEWANLVLKWCMKGDRPYWWVAETPLYTNVTRPALRQFPNTCEAGPGMPSGHVMVNAAVFYVAVRGLVQILVQRPRFLSETSKVLVSSVAYNVYMVWVTMVFVSRLYIQAHFIQQCLLGAVLGLAFGHLAWSWRTLLCLRKSQTASLCVVLVSTTVITYYYVLSQGLDPMWSVALALKHCARAEYVTVDSQAFYTAARFTGAAMGLGFGSSWSGRQAVLAARKTRLFLLLAVVGGVLIGRMFFVLLARCRVLKDDMAVYLGVGFCLNFALPYTIIALLPRSLLVLCHA